MAPMPITRPSLLFAAILGWAAVVAQAPKPPAEAGFMSHWGEIHQSAYEVWGMATVPAYGANQVNRYGRHWNLYVETPGFKDRNAIWAAVKPVAMQAGWTVVSENPNGGLLVVLHYTKDGIDAWANGSTDNQGTKFYAEIIEVMPPPVTLTLAEPAATPEKLPAQGKGDFPFLAPIPGSVALNGQEDHTPFWVTTKGANQDEIVASSSVVRNYRLKDASQPLLFTVYHDALTKAGWTIERETANNEVIVADYSRNGRNIWASLGNHGSDYSIRVGAEAAPDSLKSALASACHVALYGVLFDFNKSTLQPASDGVLTQVSTLMTANPSLNVEIQGHTDNVGTDAYNQTLSEARARSVVTWLTQHGVAAGRMTAKGYGKTQPVADNNTDDGRMKNRRVEIADPQCKPQGK
jgi:outer membrane protein OmpA-like peptidoglycan-associated protein